MIINEEELSTTKAIQYWFTLKCFKKNNDNNNNLFKKHMLQYSRSYKSVLKKGGWKTEKSPQLTPSF